MKPGDADVDEIVDERQDIAVTVDDPGERDSLRDTLKARQNQFAEHSGREERPLLVRHVVGRDVYVESELAHALRYYDRPVAVRVQNGLDELGIIVQGVAEVPNAQTQHGREDADAGDKAGCEITLLCRELSRLGVERIVVRVGKAQEREVIGSLDHPVGVEQAAIDTTPAVGVGGRS